MGKGKVGVGWSRVGGVWVSKGRVGGVGRGGVGLGRVPLVQL